MQVNSGAHPLLGLREDLVTHFDAKCIWIWTTSVKRPKGEHLLFYLKVSTSVCVGTVFQKLPLMDMLK